MALVYKLVPVLTGTKLEHGQIAAEKKDAPSVHLMVFVDVSIYESEHECMDLVAMKRVVYLSLRSYHETRVVIVMLGPLDTARSGTD